MPSASTSRTSPTATDARVVVVVVVVVVVFCYRERSEIATLRYKRIRLRVSICKSTSLVFRWLEWATPLVGVGLGGWVEQHAYRYPPEAHLQYSVQVKSRPPVSHIGMRLCVLPTSSTTTHQLRITLYQYIHVPDLPRTFCVRKSSWSPPPDQDGPRQ